MRSAVLAFVSVLSTCSATNAQDTTPQDQEQTVQSQRSYGTDARMWYVGPYILQLGQHTLIFPFETVGFGTEDPSVTIPFLLAVKHEGDAIVRLSDDLGTPTPVTITTAETVVTARLCRVRRALGGDRGDRDDNEYREEMHFSKEGRGSEEALIFPVHDGRAFVISLPKDSAQVRVSQVRIPMFAPAPIPPVSRLESTRRNLFEVASWWKNAQRALKEAGTQGGPPNVKRSGVLGEEPKHDIPESSVRDSKSEGREFRESQFIDGQRAQRARIKTGFKGPFVVRAGGDTLVFPVTKGEDPWRENASDVKMAIPFVLVVSDTAMIKVISTIGIRVTSRTTIATTGKLVIGQMPPLYVDYRYVIGFGEEEMYFQREMTGEDPIHVDLRKGRVFVVSMDGANRKLIVEQQEFDIFDPPSLALGGQLVSIRKVISGVVNWWKAHSDN